MSDKVRVIILDLLAERPEFGHGGNQEIISPIAEYCDLEILLVTPQFQTEEIGERSQSEGIVGIRENDVPTWDDGFEFWEECNLEISGNNVKFNRIAMPLHGDDQKTVEWLEMVGPDAVICSGSRRNVTMWEEWMDGGASLVRSSSQMGIPTLGICFGHQLLCKSLGSSLERAGSLSNGVWDLDLTEVGRSDFLFSTRGSGRDGSPIVLFTHQDHVITVPECCELLASTSHNAVTAVRVHGEGGDPLPSWGVQFHPEAAKARVERAFEGGYISEEELVEFSKDHDGAGILETFASVVMENIA